MQLAAPVVSARLVLDAESVPAQQVLFELRGRGSLASLLLEPGRVPFAALGSQVVLELCRLDGSDLGRFTARVVAFEATREGPRYALAVENDDDAKLRAILGQRIARRVDFGQGERVSISVTSPDGGHRVDGALVDLSLGGCAVRLDDAPWLHEHRRSVELSIQFEDGEPPVSFLARVRSRRITGDGPLFGLQFAAHTPRLQEKCLLLSTQIGMRELFLLDAVWDEER